MDPVTIRTMDRQKKIVLVTDWLTQLGGAEKVVAAIAELYPDAPIYTTFHRPEKTKSDFPNPQRIRASVFNKIPFINRKQITLAPFARTAIESLNLKEYDIIISFSSAIAKNVKKHPHQTHICYIHTPIRYAWQPEEDQRFSGLPKICQPGVDWYLKRLKKWDFAKTKAVDLFIANSSETAARVKKFYHRSAKILYPPVDIHKFSPLPRTKKKDYFFAYGRFVTYKRFDLLVETFLKLPNHTLYLGGDGPKKAELVEKVQTADAKNIKFLGRISDKKLNQYLSAATALILPQKEDAGIVQLESFAAGTPVIAYRAGGVLDVLRPGINGEFFEHQQEKDLSHAIKRFDALKYDPQEVRSTAMPYSKEKFQKNFKNLVDQFLSDQSP